MKATSVVDTDTGEVVGEIPAVRRLYDGTHFVGPVLDCSKDESRTQQQFKEECDINTILKNYEKTGRLPDMIRAEPRYGDFSDVPSYQEACALVAHAEEQFDALPSKTRERFEHDPAKFLAFAQDERNAAEMIQMGLATAKPLDKRVVKPEAPEAPQKAKADKPEK